MNVDVELVVMPPRRRPPLFEKWILYQFPVGTGVLIDFTRQLFGTSSGTSCRILKNISPSGFKISFPPALDLTKTIDGRHGCEGKRARGGKKAFRLLGQNVLPMVINTVVKRLECGLWGTGQCSSDERRSKGEGYIDAALFDVSKMLRILRNLVTWYGNERDKQRRPNI